MQPMLCSEIKESELDNYRDWWCQEKKDGIRAMIHYCHGQTIIFNRRGINITHRYPELQNSIAGDFDIYLDGEIIAKSGVFTDALTRDLNNSASRIKILEKAIPCKFVVFDMVQFNAVDLAMFPIEERYERLHSIREFFKENIEILALEQNPDYLFSLMKDNKREGIVLKKPGSTYQEGKRSNDWLKCKCWKEESITFDAYETNSAGITVTNKHGNRVLVPGAMHKKVKDSIDKIGHVDLMIQFLEKTDSGMLRQPTFKGITLDVEVDK